MASEHCTDSRRRTAVVSQAPMPIFFYFYRRPDDWAGRQARKSANRPSPRRLVSVFDTRTVRAFPTQSSCGASFGATRTSEAPLPSSLVMASESRMCVDGMAAMCASSTSLPEPSLIDPILPWRVGHTFQHNFSILPVFRPISSIC